MTTRMSIAAKLRQFRKEAGLTTKNVADEIGYSDRTVSAWERGRGEPSWDVLDQLLKLYGKQITDLYEDHLSGDRRILSNQEFRLLLVYRDLDDVGRARLYEYADDLLASGRYTRKTGDSDSVLAS